MPVRGAAEDHGELHERPGEQTNQAASSSPFPTPRLTLIRADQPCFREHVTLRGGSYVGVGRRAAELHRQQADQDLLRIGVVLVAEGAADVRHEHADAMVRQTEYLGGSAMSAIANKDWGAATRLYETCEAALDEVSVAAILLSRALHDRA